MIFLAVIIIRNICVYILTQKLIEKNNSIYLLIIQSQTSSVNLFSAISFCRKSTDPS